MAFADIDTIRDALEQLFGERITTNPGVCEAHGRGEGPMASQPPGCVVFPNSTSEVSALLKLCHGAHIPVIAFGAGTSMDGHVGGGNYHTLLLFDPNNPKQAKEAQRINQTIIEQALRLDGTCTGEHGIGQGKKDYLVKELGQDTVNIMADIKRTLDPTNILNPNKIVSID